LSELALQTVCASAETIRFANLSSLAAETLNTTLSDSLRSEQILSIATNDATQPLREASGEKFQSYLREIIGAN
jgi:hypothetical protein